MKGLLSSFWLNSIFYTGLQRVSLIIFNTVSFMIIVRSLSKENFSVWALYMTIYASIDLLKQGLLRNSTIKFLALSEFRREGAKVQTASLLLNLGLTATVILLLLLFRPAIILFLHMPGLDSLVWVLIPYMLVMVLYSHAEILLQGNFEFKKIFAAYFLRQAFFLLSVAGLLFFSRSGITVRALAWAQWSSAFLAMLLLVRFSRSLRLSWQYDFHVLMKMLAYAKYIFGTNLFTGLTQGMNQFITANVLPLPMERGTYVSYYNTINRINAAIDIPSLAAADVLFPKNVQTLEAEGLERVRYFFERMLASVICIIVPLSLIIFLFPRLILLLLAGKAYLGAASLLQLMILFSLVRPLSYQFSSTLDAIGRQRTNFLLSLLLFFFNLGMHYYFLMNYGGPGAAYASIATYLLSFLLMIIIQRKYIRFNPRRMGGYVIDQYRQIFQLLRKKKAPQSGQPQE